MPTTRKKVINTVYKDEEDSEELSGDFSDSGSEAEIPQQSSYDEDEEIGLSSDDDIVKKSKTTIRNKTISKKKSPFVKDFINKIKKQSNFDHEDVNEDILTSNFSMKDLTDADKLLPSTLNLSESDSSDNDEVPNTTKKNIVTDSLMETINTDVEDTKANIEYKNVWSYNEPDCSDEIAKKTFMELEQHKAKVEEAKISLLNYTSRNQIENESDVKDLLAQGEELVQDKKKNKKKVHDQSDSDVEDWEVVNENKSIPQQGIQLIVDIPDCVSRKTKKIDVEMMMKRKMNRVKKEYQVYMHKVHTLCWLGHGNYINSVINDQQVMSAALSLMPSKECYPGERIDMIYVEQITTWYKEKFTLKQDKHDSKFRPKAPSLKNLLLEQIKNRILKSKKYLVYIFVSLLRAIGLQCRIMVNFITVPIKPPSSELCSLSTKTDENKSNAKSKIIDKGKVKLPKKSTKTNISQLDGNNDYTSNSDSDFEYIMQVDGNDDALSIRTRSKRTTNSKTTKNDLKVDNATEEGVSPPKRPRKCTNTQLEKNNLDVKVIPKIKRKSLTLNRRQKGQLENKESVAKNEHSNTDNIGISINPKPLSSIRSRKINKNTAANTKTKNEIPPDKIGTIDKTVKGSKVIKTIEGNKNKTTSEYFSNTKPADHRKLTLSRKRSRTENTGMSFESSENIKVEKVVNTKARSKSAVKNNNTNQSKYFVVNSDINTGTEKVKVIPKIQQDNEEEQRISHRDLQKPKSDVTLDLVNIIKNRVKKAKIESKNKISKGNKYHESDDDSDFLSEVDPKPLKIESDDDFIPVKISPKPSTSRKIDRRVLSQDEEIPTNKVDVWCEIFVEELEEWVAVDVIKNKIHCVKEIYAGASHPVTYVVGWDNNNYLKDLTRRYVPHWNTVTRKQRVDSLWWNKAIQPWLSPKTARDKDEDERLNRMQLEAPLPKSIAEYKNHPLYALKRHLLKFEAIYPPDAATLGFVRNEPVYARECVYVCRSRDTWLKEAKVVRLGEQPYKVVKARPKWDKLSNKLITDKPLEVFGPWQVQDYEPPIAENGIVPRNAYGNVELFKDCMLPKGTVHIKLPGLNRIARKLNIDCAPAMTGFDFNGGWSHPVYDGFVVCKEYEEIITEAWVKDQEELERKEREKIDMRVYGNWKKLIKGLLIRERLKNKYGFEAPSTSNDKKKAKGPRLVVKKAK